MASLSDELSRDPIFARITPYYLSQEFCQGPRNGSPLDNITSQSDLDSATLVKGDTINLIRGHAAVIDIGTSSDRVISLPRHLSQIGALECAIAYDGSFLLYLIMVDVDNFLRELESSLDPVRRGVDERLEHLRQTNPTIIRLPETRTEAVLVISYTHPDPTILHIPPPVIRIPRAFRF